MTKGRRLLYDEKLKPNGLSVELDNWFHDQAKRMGITTSALKRIALETYKQNAMQHEPEPKDEILPVG